MKKFDIFYFSSTHWDREWYQDFQGFRARLVKMTNALLSLIENDPEYRTFHFDGQTVVLEDYLEIAPERREELAARIREGRILIGPWYVMPDELLVSGESIIRNLMKGHKIAKDFGVEPWKFGYVCDCFGHIAQLPQILSGFGIKHSLLGRGMNESMPTYSYWTSPDGSKTLNFMLEPYFGYGNFKSRVYDPIPKANRGVDNPEIVDRIKKFVDGELERTDGVPVVIVMDGLDHAQAEPNTTAYINKMRELYPEAEVHHVDLNRAFEVIEKMDIDLPTVAGELNKTSIRSNPYLHLITNTLSSYYPIKRANDICQTLLEKRIEPLGVMAMDGPVSINRSYINLAYRYLIQNHPHDSICGCSIDQVHKDMEYRFDQVLEISDMLTCEYLYGTPDYNRNQKGNEGILRFTNTLPYDIERTMEVELRFLPEFKAVYYEPFGYEKINAFKIYDKDGNEIPYKLNSIKRNSSTPIYEDYAKCFDKHNVTLTVKVPAFGYSEYKVVPVSTSVRYLKHLTSGLSFAENECLRVDINTNGTLKLTDKKNGRVYDNLCSLLDDGEIGDGWMHVNPADDFSVSSVGGSAVIEKIEDGAARVVFRVTRTMSLPECLITDDHGKRRSGKRVELKVEMDVGVAENQPYVDVNVRTVNTAADHRLKLMLPTGIKTDKYFASQAFYFAERKVGIDYSTQDWREPEQYEKATGGIVGKRDEDGTGVALVSAYGIHECSSYEGEEGMLSVTLLRSFTNTTRTDGGERCKLLGVPLEYKLAIAPMRADTSYADLLRISDSISVSPLYTLEFSERAKQPTSDRGIVCVEGKNIATSVIKCAESGEDGAVVVRVFNASEQTSSGEITTKYPLTRVEFVNLNEEKMSDLPCDENKVSFTLEPWKIATFKLYLNI